MGAYVNNDKGRPQHRELRSLLFARSALVLQRPLLTISEKRMGTELTAYLPYPRRLECLISCLCHSKGSHWSLGRNYFTTLGVGTSCTPVLRSTTLVNRARIVKLSKADSISFIIIFSFVFLQEIFRELYFHTLLGRYVTDFNRNMFFFLINCRLLCSTWSLTKCCWN